MRHYFRIIAITFIFLSITVVITLAQPLEPSAATSVAQSTTSSSAINFLPKGDVLSRKAVMTITTVLSGYMIMIALIMLINRQVRDMKVRYFVRKNIIYVFNFSLLLIVFLIWIQNLNHITILLGFASAGLALALQEVILSIAGWLLILIRRPFEVGDRIELNGVKGDVIDIRLFQTSLLEIGNWVDADQSTGRIVNLPNSLVFKGENYNYSRGFEFIGMKSKY